jgi:hypothetical protein
MAAEDSIAAQVFATWGARARQLATSTKEETDWLVELDGFRLLVEEKDKLEDPTRSQARIDDLRAGRVHGINVPLSHNNRISGIVRKATQQLQSTGVDVAHDAKIVWFTGVGFDGEAKHLQFMATLYGSTDILEIDKTYMKECYFFRNGDFFRYKDCLDGAVAAYLRGDEVNIKLCLNPYGANWMTLRDSPVARQFKKGLIDPVAEEAAGKAYIADCDLPRADSGPIFRYLQEKYGLGQITNMDMNMATAVVPVRP